MTDKELLGSDNLTKLFQQFNGAEGEVLDYLRAHCKKTVNGDIQSIVEGYEATHQIPNFRLLSERQESEEEAFHKAVNAPASEARAFIKANEGKKLSPIDQMRMNGYREHLVYSPNK